MLQAVSVWFAFWLIGLPDYFQQYSTVTMAVGSIFLSVAISLAAALLRLAPWSWVCVFRKVLVSHRFLHHALAHLYAYRRAT
jgi:hypothetical protein